MISNTFQLITLEIDISLRLGELKALNCKPLQFNSKAQLHRTQARILGAYSETCLLVCVGKIVFGVNEKMTDDILNYCSWKILFCVFIETFGLKFWYCVCCLLSGDHHISFLLQYSHLSLFLLGYILQIYSHAIYVCVCVCVCVCVWVGGWVGWCVCVSVCTLLAELI